MKRLIHEIILLVLIKFDNRLNPAHISLKHNKTIDSRIKIVFIVSGIQTC